MIKSLLLVMLSLALTGVAQAADGAGTIRVTGPWQVSVTAGRFTVGSDTVNVRASAAFDIAPPPLLSVQNEQHAALPVYNPTAAGWTRGAKLVKLVAMECTKRGLLDPASVVVKSAAGDGTVFKRGVDYEFEPDWATLGRLDGGAIAANQPVLVDYQYGASRIDSLVVNARGAVVLVPGIPEVVSPQPPAVPSGSTVIANIWVPGRSSALTGDSLYPIIEPAYPKTVSAHPVAEKLLPKTWAKLNSGQTVEILTWGDSVSTGAAASDVAHRYQERFATLLAAKYPKATVHMTTVAWGGRNSQSFLSEPSGSPHNFEEKVVAPHPDLIIMEFVNDSGTPTAVLEKRYSGFVDLFRKEGIEYIIVAPHFTNHQMMNAPSDRISADTRPYIKFVREFAPREGIALADWSQRWEHLQAEGVPYETLLLNGINHPNNKGHEMLAQALIDLFGG
ncbi:MAG: GDSL-type esterase/lipase family protein [Capsulimonadaceae bacterium]|nr:GDSL-type esterase/lipase family protein [Capsulimonadaceae bacterium]